MNEERRHFLVTAAATIAAARYGLERAAGTGGDELASLQTATAWLNSQPLTAAGLRGKVVLVSFWTYTCINWLRTQPDHAAVPRGERRLRQHDSSEKLVFPGRASAECHAVTYPDAGHGSLFQFHDSFVYQAKLFPGLAVRTWCDAASR